ncbi:PKD domain-containing protein, partial [Aestuariibaculum sp. TT11]|nr:PKD domain-containing protein [Aestuariibaculum sediminum]
MKTSTFKKNLLNILTCLFILVGKNIYAQATSTTTLETPCLSSKCVANDVKILNVYLADANGNEVATCTTGEFVALYLWANIESSSKSNLLIQYNLLINDVQVNPSNQKYTERLFINQAIDDSAPIRLSQIPGGYICGDGIQLTGIYISWQPPNDNNGPRCNDTKCNNEQPDIVVPTPLSVDFTYKTCTTGNTATVYFESLTTGGDENYTYNWGFDGGTPTTGTNIPNPIVTYDVSSAPKTITLTVVDGQGTQNLFPTTLTIQSFPNEITLNSAQVTSSINCSGETAEITFIASGGVGQLTYNFNGQTNTTGVFTGVPAGTNQVYTITDINSCEITGDVDVAPGDSQAPSVTAPEDYSVNACDETGITGLTYSEIPITISLADLQNSPGGNGNVTDNNSVQSITYFDSMSGSCPITVTRTFTATDACGNSASDTQTIQVLDSTDPVITAPADDTIEACDITGLANFSTTAVDITGDAVAYGYSVTEACDYTVTYQDSQSGTCPIVVTRTFTATDACGNSDTDTQTITIDDTINPVITAPADDTIEACDINGLNDFSTTAVDITGDAVAYGYSVTEACDYTVTYQDSQSGSCPITVTRTFTA